MQCMKYFLSSPRLLHQGMVIESTFFFFFMSGKDSVFLLLACLLVCLGCMDPLRLFANEIHVVSFLPGISCLFAAAILPRKGPVECVVLHHPYLSRAKNETGK